MIPFKYLLKSMLMNRTRAVLTIFAIAWGTFTIAIMLAVGEGLRLTFGQVINHLGTAALVISGKQTTKSHHGQSSGIQIMLTQHDLDRLKKILLGRAEITGSVLSDRAITYGAKMTRGMPVTAVAPEYADFHAIKTLPSGRFIDGADDELRRQVIVLGDRTYHKLFKPHENAVGKTVYVAGKPFIVIGVQRQSLQLIMTSQYPDEFTNWVPYQTYQALTNDYNYSNFFVAPKDLSQVSQLQNEIRHFITKDRQLGPDDLGILDFINIQQEKQKIMLFFYGIEMVLGIIGALTLVVAGVGALNVMYISVRSATREIGVRMALGATTFDILLYYICEALLTAAIGGTLGAFLAKGTVMLINLVPMDSELLQYLGRPRPILSIQLIFIVIITLGAISLTAGAFPARKAASIDPVEALRYE